MTDEHGKQSGGIRWGISASVMLHMALAVALFVRLPPAVSEPKEETVNVELVPPAEEKEAEEQTPPEAPKPEAAKPDEKQEEAKKEEARKEQPPPPVPKPEPAKQEEAKKDAASAPPLPPPPEPLKEEAKQPEPPPPDVEEQAKQEPAADEQESPRSMPAAAPVFQFGDKEAGPRQSLTGNGTEDGAATPTDGEQDPQATAGAETETADQSKPAEETSVKETPMAEALTAEAPMPANPIPDDISVPEIGIASTDPQHDGPAAGASPDAVRMQLVAPPKTTDPTVKDQPSKTPPVKIPADEKPAELKKAKTLFSRSVTNDPTATVAMGSLSRGARAGELCRSELQMQLQSMSYPVYMVPRIPLPSGTVLAPDKVAFFAGNQWYDVAFRCEIDDDATKVVSFALDVGGATPRSEWARRRLPKL